MKKVVCAITLSFLAACGSGGGQRKTSALAPPDTVIEPETPLAIYGTRTVGTTPTTGALDATQLKNALYSVCWSQVEAALPDFCPNSGVLDDNGCLGHQCLMQIHICIGHKYMEIAQETNEFTFNTLLLGGSEPTYTLPLSGSTITYDIPPQSAENRTLAFELAITAFSKGGERAVTAISSTAPNCFTTTPGGINSTVTENDIKKNRAMVFATTYADTIQALVEAQHRFTGNSLQVAGFQRQRVRDYGEAGQWLWNGRVNSVRAVAAAMGNDDDGSPVDQTLPTCIPSLKNKASMQASLALQRRVALAETLGSTTTDNFLTSIRNAMETANPELDFGTMTNDEFLDHFDLSRSDIAEGRQYLQEEHEAFQRTDVETFPGSGRIAGIATEPHRLPIAAAVAKTAGTRLQSSYTVAQTSYRGSGVIQMLDYLRWGVRRAFRVSALPAVIQPTFRAAQAIAEAETGTLRVSVVSNGATSVKVNVHGVSSTDKFVVVNGLDGARCLSEGTIEGAPCDPADYILDDTGTFAGGDPGNVHELSNTLTYHVGTTGVENLYLLSADGKWEALAGFNPAGIPGSANAILTPIGGLIHGELAEAMAPHPEECGETAQDCVGLPADLVIPLESELTENNDPYENSWLHYLDLAEQMALEADALGEDLIVAGLENDVRAEAARDELEAACGGVQNVGTIHDGVAGTDPSLESCLPSTDPESPTYLEKWVTLGQHQFCVLAGNHDGVCDGSCRADLQQDGTCPELYVPVVTLGLVTTERPPGEVDCRPLADLYTGAADDRLEDVEDLLQGRGRWARLDKLSPLMGYALYDEKYPYGLEISLDGTTILELGNTSTPPYLDPSQDAEQNVALRTVAGGVFNTLPANPTTDQRKTFILNARRAFGTLGLLTGNLRSNMRRSWVAPGDYTDACRAANSDPNIGVCDNVADATLEYRVSDCDALGGCRCRRDPPSGPPWDYGNIHCSEGARFDYIVDFDLDPVVIETWHALWSAGGGIDCVRPPDAPPALEQVLCSIPRGNRFGYPWSDLFDFPAAGAIPAQGFGGEDWYPAAQEAGLGFLSQPGDILAPTEAEADPGLDAATVTDYDVYRALALACFMQLGGGGIGCPSFDPRNPPDPPTVNNAGDLRLVEQRVSCAADAVRHAASRVLVANIPKAVVDGVHSSEPQSLYPSFRGELLEALTAVQADLQQIAAYAGSLEAQLRRAQTATQLARESLAVNGVQQEIQELQTLSNMLSLAASAAAGAMTSFGSSTAFTAGQFILTAEIADLEEELARLQAAQILTQFTSQVGDILAEINSVGTDLHQAVYRLNADLGRIESIQGRAQSAAARVAFQDEDAAGRLYPVTTVMRKRYNTLAIRYQRAKDRARQMAFIARKAIEQRFALDLSQMNEDLTLVEAPATWARDVCEFEGIDYERIREAHPDDPEVDDDYVDGYLGEYVDKLRLFVETYPFDFPFQDGSDLAVISLRDDILRARQDCEVPVPNLLASSEPIFGVVGGPEETEPAWFVDECADLNPDGTQRSCMFLESRAQLAVSGRLANRIADADLAMTDTTGVVVQEIEVDRPGRLLLSWTDAFLVPDGVLIDSVGVQSPTPYEVTLSRVGSAESYTSDPPFTPAAQGATSTRAMVLDITDGGTIRLEIDPSSEQYAHGDVWFWKLQLELLEGLRADEEPSLIDCRPIDQCQAPSEYTKTTQSGLAWLDVCADFDGRALREEFFIHRCEQLCTDGVGESCGDAGLLLDDACFFETSFGIGLDQIERGELIPSGAIALGNYNYRHELVGVNLVGTNVRDCTLSDQPATCYANAFVPVSLIHAGEAAIRNHTGDDVSFDFGRGSIEHGKALASEVVLTNPLTGAMETLLQPYYKEELRGRPLTGQYWLRIWDDPALNWDNVEDVQLVFRYRYWTRFGE